MVEKRFVTKSTGYANSEISRLEGIHLLDWKVYTYWMNLKIFNDYLI